MGNAENTPISLKSADNSVPFWETTTKACRFETGEARFSDRLPPYFALAHEVHCTRQSMNAMGIAAASGIRARMESLEMLANNLANAGTAGFKADREQYGIYWSAESASALDGARGGAGASPVIEKNWIDFGQGALTRTGVDTHLGLNGPGFLAVQRGEQTLYTRNGELQVAANGTLVNGQGLAVLGRNGQPVRVDASRPLEIRADGSIWQDGQTTGQLRLVEFDNPQGLKKAGHTYFEWPGEVSEARVARATAVTQGTLETANASPADGAVRMVNVLRQFESLQKAMQLDNEMSRRLIDDVAKV